MTMKIADCVWFSLTGFLLLLSSLESESYRILIVPTPQKSHLSCLKTVAEELVSRGHRVHLVYRDDFPTNFLPLDSERFKIVLYHAKIPAFMPPNSSYDDLVELLVRRSMNKEPGHALLKVASELMRAECRQLLLNSEDNIKSLENEKFDIAVVDGNFLTHCFFLLPFRLHIPWITYTDTLEPLAVPVPWLPSFVPSALTTFTERMDFKQRILNTAAEMFMFSGYLTTKLPEDVYKAYQRYGHFDSPEDLAQQSQLFLSSRDIVLEYARPTMPNIIDIGGLTTRPAKNISEDLQSFLNGSRDGNILATFGTMTKTLPREIAKKFLIVFGRLKGYRVIFKFDNTNNLTIPANVRIESWLPQQDILGHPRTKLFVTHCGNNGQYESVYHGVPMIGLPLHSDEPYNAMRIEHKGYGIAMDILDFTSDDLYNNIVKVLTNPSYKDRVSLASKIFRSAKQRPAERAAFWIEHVIKFGSHHLQSAGKDLNFFQYFLLDVLGTIALVVVSLLYLAWKLVFLVFEKVLKCGRKDKLKAN